MRAQVGEAGRVAGAGHLDSQSFGGGRAEQPGQVGADHVGADERQQARAEHHRVEPAVPNRGGLAPSDRKRPPVDPAVAGGAAGQPSLLPALTGLCLKPVQDDTNAAAAVLLPSGGVRDERRSEQPLVHQRARQPGLWPRRGHRARREPCTQCLVLLLAAVLAGSGHAASRTRAQIRAGAHESVPNNTLNDSARYRAGFEAAAGAGLLARS